MLLPSLLEGLRRRVRLGIWWRQKLDAKEFQGGHKLFRGFGCDDLDEFGNLDIESFESSDISVNWSRFSVPSDVRYRVGGALTDGCMSFTVEQARRDSAAMPCHCPLAEPVPNYAHAEIRWLRKGETNEPPHGRSNAKSVSMKKMRQAWKSHIVSVAIRELEATR